jgi:hypothetical protein
MSNSAGTKSKTAEKYPQELLKRGITPLKPKRLAFVENYTKHHNATLAAIQAGYSIKNAHNTGYRILNDAKLKKRIESYGQLGLDRLAIIAATSTNHIAAEKAAEALVERAYGKAKNNDDNRGNIPNIVISFNKINTDGKVIEASSIAANTLEQKENKEYIEQ